MSILNYLTEYTKDYMPPSIAWREKRVWHRTKSGEMHFVKVKSLSPDEQMRYKPIDLIKKNKRAEKLNKKIRVLKSKEEIEPTQEPVVAEPKAKVEGEMFDFYYGIKDPSKYKEFNEDELVEATLDSAKAVDMEDDEGLHIVIAKNVPLDAIKEYMDEEGDWKEIEIEDKLKKAEFIEFGDNDFFKLDLYPYKDIVELELQNDEEIEEMKDYERYLVDKEVCFLMENNMLELINEDMVDPKIKEFAKSIGKKLGLEYRGFADIDVDEYPEFKKFLNHANYHDPITNSTFVIDILHDFITTLKIGWENLKAARKKFDKPEPPIPAEIQMEI